ncbi:MAG TPA: dihydrolipoamide acetyltransferase family protein, partial [Caldilineaceae bacterium]|nr:dihydrolipoamide acetyltransferase family protein [Caldilineaceae bacterium]
MAEFKMPSLGADMTTGTLIEWTVKPGDHLNRGDIIAVVGTEKGEIEVEVFDEGVVEQLLVPEGAETPVGAALAILRGAGEAAPALVAEKAAPAPPPPAPAVAVAERIRVTPLARKLAAELGVDLNLVHGTGEQGAITRADIEAAAQAAKPVIAPPLPVIPAPVVAERIAPPAKPAPAPPLVEKPAPPAADFAPAMRHAIALAMARANREIPHYYLQMRIDMSKALKWLEAENQKRAIKERVLAVVLLLKAVARALVEIPELNGYWVDDHLQAQEAINIGFAIALRQGGLITPAIHNVDLKNMDELMEAVRDLIMRTRSGRLRSSELTDATITLTNLGDLGVETVYGVIYPPQVALVGFGKVSDQPWVENGMIGIRPVL